MANDFDENVNYVIKDQILNAVRISIRTRMNQLADHVAGGDCKDWDEYQHVTGKILGLAEAERDLIDIDQRQNAVEDED